MNIAKLIPEAGTLPERKIRKTVLQLPGVGDETLPVLCERSRISITATGEFLGFHYVLTLPKPQPEHEVPITAVDKSRAVFRYNFSQNGFFMQSVQYLLSSPLASPNDCAEIYSVSGGDSSTPICSITPTGKTTPKARSKLSKFYEGVFCRLERAGDAFMLEMVRCRCTIAGS